MSIYLVRHAEPRSALAADLDEILTDKANGLTAYGVQQAVNLAAYFLKTFVGKAVHLYSSPLQRAIETAQRIEEVLKVDAIVDRRLAERDFGLRPGTTNIASKKAQLWSHANPLKRNGEGESVVDHRARVQQWFFELLEHTKREPSQEFVVVSHGGTMEHIMGCVFGAPPDSISHYYIQCPCAHFHKLSVVYPTKDEWSVIRVDSLSQGPLGLDLPT